MGQKMIFIVNPVSAAKQTQKEWPQFDAEIRHAGFEFDVVFTQKPEHATELTREALKKGYNTIVSVGGDGTMNEVLNGFYEDGMALNPEARLAVLSRGTGCDFIKSLKLDKGLNDFLALLKRQEVKTVDVGHVVYDSYKGNRVGKYFLNISDIGIGAETTNRVNKNSKIMKGFISFAYGAVVSILSFNNKHLQVAIDNKILLDEKLSCVVIANGQYFGGGMQVAPNAAMDDGLFDIITIGNMSKMEMIKSFPTIYKGTHLTNPKVKTYKGSNITVKCLNPAMIEIDGEQPGWGNAEFKMIAGGLKLLV